MKYEYFIKEFNKVYIIKLFQDDKWKNFSYKSKWFKKTMAGPPKDLLKKYPLDERFNKPITQMDSDNSWFNNP